MPIEPPYQEKELLQQVSQGDERSFTAVVDHYWNKIYSIALIFTKSPDLSQDILQETFLKVWARRHTLGDIRKFDAWLFILARNEILNTLRSKGPIFSAIDQMEQEAEKTGSPEEALHLKQLQELIRRGVEQLPPQQKLIYKMSREEGLSHDEICVRLGLARSTVKNTLVKALGALRDYLRGHEQVFLVMIALLWERL